jgi:hypothetical protein
VAGPVDWTRVGFLAFDVGTTFVTKNPENPMEVLDNPAYDVFT